MQPRPGARSRSTTPWRRRHDPHPKRPVHPGPHHHPAPPRPPRRLPLAPAWGSGPPRARSIFAQAREAGTDPAEVRPDVDLARPPIDPQIICDVEAA
ncbi:hypothetical protein [Nonomuraea sp. NPDC049784]|uniref:hypothetical protein n=1 Tax=Nonomuraea sp. NPDC049784 TaxID=3154361 RepID=UPI0033F07B34